MDQHLSGANSVPPEAEDLHLDPQSAIEANGVDDGGEPEAAVEAQRPTRVADCIGVLIAQVDAAFPSRSTKSDGTVGDLAHQKRPSDHNPRVIDGRFGVVTAVDITHDPDKGCDAGRIVDALHASRDPRIKYIIYNRRIANASPIGAAPAWQWRAYTGANPHTKHCHISVKSAKALYDNERAWAMPGDGAVETAAVEPTPEALIRGALSTLAGSEDRPLIELLCDAQDAIAELLARLAEAERAPAEGEAGVEAVSLPALRQGYLQLWNTVRVDPARVGMVAWHTNKLRKGRPRYEEVARITGTPWWFVGIVHALEASFNFAGHLHNGDPLVRPTVQVPRNRPRPWNPPSDWVSSAVDAITGDDNAHQADWSITATLFRFERYNGFGYHSKGIESPYLWSFSNHYSKGKFVADGRYDSSAVSRQCGAAVMLKALIDAGDVAL